MRIKSGLLCVSLLSLLAFESGTWAHQEAPPAQAPATAPPQGPGRGGERRPGVLGKLTAIHDQTMEITSQNGDIVTVKISGTTQFRKDREAAKLSDFKVGDIVFVRGEENPDHSWNAEMIGTRSGGGPGGQQGGRGGGDGVQRGDGGGAFHQT